MKHAPWWGLDAEGRSAAQAAWAITADAERRREMEGYQREALCRETLAGDPAAGDGQPGAGMGAEDGAEQANAGDADEDKTYSFCGAFGDQPGGGGGGGGTA